MAWLIIPTTPSIPFQSMKVTLEGRIFILALAWNMREGRWYFSMLDEESNPIVSGMKLTTPMWPLLQFHRWNPAVPPGEFFVANFSGQGGPPGLDDLGADLRCELLYRESTT